MIILFKNPFIQGNLLTLLSYAIIALMAYIAISTENRRKANVLIMVSTLVIKTRWNMKYQLIRNEFASIGSHKFAHWCSLKQLLRF